MIADEQLQRWNDLAAAATRGPWRWRGSSVEQISDAGKGYPIDFYEDCETIQESQCLQCGTRIGLSEDNGQFVAAAREAVPALIAECATLRERLLNGPTEPGDLSERIRTNLSADRDRLRAGLKEACDLTSSLLDEIAKLTAEMAGFFPTLVGTDEARLAMDEHKHGTDLLRARIAELLQLAGGAQ